MEANAPPSDSRAHVVITGASSGIGAALAEAYARQGARLSLLGRNASRLTEIAARCTELGGACQTFVADITDESLMHRLLAATDSEVPIDIVIANAGVGGGDSLAAHTGEDATTAAQILRTNVLGVVHTVAPLVPSFVARKKGHIVIVGSLAGFVGLPDSPAYSASKAAVRTYGQALRRLTAGSGVKVTVVSPGFVDTPMCASLPFRTPFTWSAERAAAQIVKGVERGKGEIIFPLPLAIAAGLASFLPVRITDAVLTRLRGATFRKKS